MDEPREPEPETTPTPAPEEASPADGGAVPAMETASPQDVPTEAGAEQADAEAAQGAAAGSAGDDAKPSLTKVKKLQQRHERAPRRAGGKGGEAKGEGGQAKGNGQPRRRGGAGGKGKGRKGAQEPQRAKGPLPFDELREAAKAIMRDHGSRPALREAFNLLAQKERTQIAEMVAGDGDFRARARSISAGSLAAGKLGKALAAQQIAIAEPPDLWPLCLSKEEAAERQAWIRRGRERDERQAKRKADRANRQDRIAKEDMEKARDGRVGASIRFVGFEDVAASPEPAAPEPEAPAADEPEPAKKGSSVLDRLGY